MVSSMVGLRTRGQDRFSKRGLSKYPVPATILCTTSTGSAKCNWDSGYGGGSSSVVFSRPYLYAGVTTIVLAVALAVETGFVLRRRGKPAASGPGPGVVTG